MLVFNKPSTSIFFKTKLSLPSAILLPKLPYAYQIELVFYMALFMAESFLGILNVTGLLRIQTSTIFDKCHRVLRKWV